MTIEERINLMNHAVEECKKCVEFLTKDAVPGIEPYTLKIEELRKWNKRIIEISGINKEMKE